MSPAGNSHMCLAPRRRCSCQTEGTICHLERLGRFVLRRFQPAKQCRSRWAKSLLGLPPSSYPDPETERLLTALGRCHQSSMRDESARAVSLRQIQLRYQHKEGFLLARLLAGGHLRLSRSHSFHVNCRRRSKREEIRYSPSMRTISCKRRSQ